jgi:membrane associated rhomboid family serine protease
MILDHADWVAVYRSAFQSECRRRALILHAAGIDSIVRTEHGQYAVAVRPSDHEDASEELADYESEVAAASTNLAGVPSSRRGWAGVGGFVVVLSVSALLPDQQAFGFDWLAAGKTHAGLIRQGEWWRTVTALTLHADLVHLTSNLVFGSLVGLFVGQSLGSGLAWLAMLGGGSLGNLLNACVRGPEHASLGASTAVFAGIGLLAADAWRRQPSSTSKMQRWAPWIGGLLLLSYLGTSGERTDVAAHVMGFLAGCLLGFVVGRRRRGWALHAWAQRTFGLTAVTIIVISWVAAWVHRPA